jgi:small subunit ribosomal protein S16
MVKIRLARYGKKNNPFYRVVAVESARKNKGKALAILGHWHPQTDEVKIDKTEIKKWIDNGALVSPAVQKLMK